MTPKQVKLVQQSFEQVLPIADQAADLFYDRLFQLEPALRSMFPDDMSEQKRKLMDMLGAAIANLHQVETMLPTLKDLGRRHVGYGTQPEHYDLVGEALLWTLEQGLGAAFTPAVKEAWTETYTTVARTMKSAAAELSRDVSRAC